LSHSIQQSINNLKQFYSKGVENKQRISDPINISFYLRLSFKILLVFFMAKFSGERLLLQVPSLKFKQFQLSHSNDKNFKKRSQRTKLWK
jgi:hypothetical protein